MNGMLSGQKNHQKIGLYKTKKDKSLANHYDLKEICPVLEAGLEPARLLRPKDFKSPPNPPFELCVYLSYLIVNLVFNSSNNSVLES